MLHLILIRDERYELVKALLCAINAVVPKEKEISLDKMNNS